MIAIEVGFHQKPKDPGPEPLQMEHFHFPLGMWFVGILISLFCFLAEIIRHRRRKSSDVPMLTQEELSVTQSTPELEVEHNTDLEDIEDTVV